LYDTIGATYAVMRRTEARIAAKIWAALGDARTVLNVGAGTGSYEPPGRGVVAVERLAVMGRSARQAQRRAWLAPRRTSRNGPASGRWVECNRDLVALDAAELGLRLLVA
jgi:hypothetical protein